MFVEVALNLPLHGSFTWSVPDHLAAFAQRGHRVLVPFRNRIELGVVLRTTEHPPENVKRVRAISEALDREPFLPEHLLSLTEWIASYYHSPVGESVHLAVPSALAPPKGDVGYALVENLPQANVINSLDEQLIEALQHSSPRTLSELKGLVSGVTQADIDRLEDAGVIRLIEQASARKTRTDLRLNRTEIPREKREGDKQRQTLDFLEEHGETWFSEIRDLYGISRATLKPLIDKGLVSCEEVSLEYDPFGDHRLQRRSSDPSLTEDQANALASIVSALSDGVAKTFLLQGVTGSGKTEVYLRAIREVRRQGKRALVLLPEIALTPQFINVIRAALDEELAVLHSALTPAQRRSQWNRIRRGEIGVAVGARSSLFSPMENIGLIIVDEEHDPSFKQHEGVRYNARDAALVLAQKHQAVTVLGSATPSMETLHNARTGKFGTLLMPKRVADRPMPSIELVDLKTATQGEDSSDGIVITDLLLSALRSTVDSGEQAILFLNRRGFAPEIRCMSCGESLDCPACERAMTFHQRGRVVVCHHCGHSRPIPPACPTCNERALEPQGAGTERLEAVLESRLEGFRVGRLDRDISKARAMEQVLTDFRERKLDVLVGTQMVTKGHDFPNVTLVGVLSGDQSLTFADFRSGERTWQLLTQVAGRAGRGVLPGRVIIQTWKPEHPVLQAVVSNDFESLVAYELRARQREGLPPFGHVALLRIQGPDQDELRRVADQLFRWLASHADPSVRFVAPVDAPIPRVRDRWRMQIMIRSPHRAPIHDLLRRFNAATKIEVDKYEKKGIRWAVDVDPQSLM